MLKALEQFAASHTRLLDGKPYGRKAHATYLGQLRNFKENFQICYLLFFFSSGLLKESCFRAKTPRSELLVFFICTICRFVCAEQGANRSSSKKKQKVEQETLLPTTAIIYDISLVKTLRKQVKLE